MEEDFAFTYFSAVLERKSHRSEIWSEYASHIGIYFSMTEDERKAQYAFMIWRFKATS